jgi:hypothetical protein
MSYRDDREALHQRVAQLEDQLKDAQREGQEQGRDAALTRAAELEEKVANMRGELQMMEAELQAMRGASPSKRWLPLAAASLGICALGVVIATRRPPAQPPATPIVVAVPPLPPPPSPAPAPEPPPEKASTPPADDPKPDPPPRSTSARWSAKVSRAEGGAVAPGTACTIDAAIVTDSATNAVVRGLDIVCGSQKLYRSGDSLSGMSQMSDDAREVLGPADDKSTFTLMYRDIGSRTGERSQVDLDTNARQGAVFRETIPRFRVELTMAPASAPGAPLSGPDERLRRAGKVSEVSGTLALKSGAPCRLRAMPNGKDRDCVAEVTCGTTVLWPQSAPVTCTYDGARPTSVASVPGSTSTLALDGSALAVKTQTFDVTIALEEP